MLTRPAWAAPSIRVYLDDEYGNATQLLPIRGLDVDGRRVYHAFGPPGELATGQLRINPDTEDGLCIYVRVYTDPRDQVRRFSPLRPIVQANN